MLDLAKNFHVFLFLQLYLCFFLRNYLKFFWSCIKFLIVDVVVIVFFLPFVPPSSFPPKIYQIENNFFIKNNNNCYTTIKNKKINKNQRGTKSCKTQHVVTVEAILKHYVIFLKDLKFIESGKLDHKFRDSHASKLTNNITSIYPTLSLSNAHTHKTSVYV